MKIKLECRICRKEFECKSYDTAHNCASKNNLTHVIIREQGKRTGYYICRECKNTYFDRKYDIDDHGVMYEIPEI